MWHSHLNDMEIPETKRFIPKGFELGTTLSKPIGSIVSKFKSCLIDEVVIRRVDKGRITHVKRLMRL